MPDYEIEKLFASKLIARTDVKALQISSIAYNPVFEPWTRQDLTDHLAKTKTFGHYLVNPDNECKVFCFDIDLKKGKGYLPTLPMDAMEDEHVFERSFQERDLRAAWLDRRDKGRSWTKYQLKMIALSFMRRIKEDLELQTAMAYSGSKGLHVYAFGDRMPAADAREGAMYILDSLDTWKLSKGHSTFEHKDQDPIKGFPNFDVEVYPKQDTLDGKHLGNLLRLPLGRNKKAPDDPTFFLDPRSAVAEWLPADPIWALTTTNPWED